MNLTPLIYWVQEREAIRRRKDAGEPFPWTKDEILRTYRFCNVRREDDRVTKWIDANIRKPFAEHHHLWFMLCAARQINWPPTLQMLIDDRVCVNCGRRENNHAVAGVTFCNFKAKP